jgi:hypothetical protein
LTTGVLVASPCAFAGTAHADLLGLERWATNQGGWIAPSTFLVGDFDGNGKDDLAYIWIACDACGNPFVPGEYGIIPGIDLHLSCDNAGVPCPPGVNPNTTGAFVLDHTIGGIASQLGCEMDTCQGFLGACGIGISGETCNVITGSKLQWLAGDFDGDGKTDLALVYATHGQIKIQVGISQGLLGNVGSFSWSVWNTGQGGWVDPSTWVVGDFDGDGKDDLGYVFKDPGNGNIDIDVHRSLGSAAAGGFQLRRWATNQGGWPDNRVFMASDVNGDGMADVELAFEDAGHIDLDAHLSTGSSFQLQRWATNQGAWINGGAGVAQWTSVPGYFGRRDRERGASLITPLFTPAPGNGLGGAGLGDLIYAFNANGAIDIDGHLATLNDAVPAGNTFGTTQGFNLQRYATNQGTYPQTVQFLGGDFNGDSVGDVADAFEVNGQIDIDVHKGLCAGPIAQSGQCCLPFTTICNGACCAGTCSNSPSAINGCCLYGETCPPPPPPP